MKSTTLNSLGRTDVKVSALSYGGAPIGNFMRPFTEEAAAEIVDQAWDLGVRFFDTAPLYGHGLSEQRLGHALASRQREDFVLSSKAGRVMEPADPSTIDSGLWVQPAPNAAVYDYSYDGIMRSVEQSLERLGTDYLDIIFMHDIDRYTHGDEQPVMFAKAIDEGFAALVKLREQGVAKAIGVGVNEADVCSEAVRRVDADTVLLAGRYTLLEQEPLDDLMPLCQERGIGVVLGGVYNSGVLATGSVPGAKFNYGPATEAVLNRVRRIENICTNFEVPLAAVAMQFAAAHPTVASICIGSRTQQQQTNSVELFNSEVPQEVWEQLRAEGLLRDDAPVPHLAEDRI